MHLVPQLSFQGTVLLSTELRGWGLTTCIQLKQPIPLGLTPFIAHFPMRNHCRLHDLSRLWGLIPPLRRQDLSLPSPPIFTCYSVLYSCYLLLALKMGLLFNFFSLSLPWFFKRRNTVLCHLKLDVWNMLLTIDPQCLEKHQYVSFLLLHCKLP